LSAEFNASSAFQILDVSSSCPWKSSITDSSPYTHPILFTSSSI
jgi:hypothetical protein